MEMFRGRMKLLSGLLMLTSLMGSPACVKKKGSQLATRFDADVERIDLGRGVNSATGLVAGACLKLNPATDIVKINAESYDWDAYLGRYVAPSGNANPADPRNANPPDLQPGDAVKTKLMVKPSQFTWIINLIRDSYDFQRQLEVAGAAKFNNGAIAASATARFGQSVKFSSSSIFLLIDIRMVTERKKINMESPTVELVKAFIPRNGLEASGKEWTESCGDEVVSEVTYGARRLLLLEMQNASELKKQEMEAQFKVGGVTGTGGMSFREQLTKISTHSAVNVTGFQQGGLLWNLASQLNPEGLIADTEAWMREVQSLSQYVPINYSSDKWSQVGPFKTLMTNRGIIAQEGKSFFLDKLARRYGQSRDMLAFAEYALRNPHLVTDVDETVATPGVKRPGLSSDKTDQIQNLIKKLEKSVLLMESFAAECSLDESKCLKESEIIAIEMADDSLEYLPYKYFSKLQKELESDKILARLKLLPQPEVKRDILCHEVLKLEPLYNLCDDPSKPTKFKYAKHEKCGPAIVKMERAERCGVERWNSRHDCGVCGRSWGWKDATSCKSCESSNFGVALFSECASLDGAGKPIVLEYQSCEIPENGADGYEKSRRPECGVELQPECVVIVNANGEKKVDTRENYYRK